jgi:L-arabinose isomerase
VQCRGLQHAFDVAGWMNRWAEQAPTHHVALGVGHVADSIENSARLIGLACVRL